MTKRTSEVIPSGEARHHPKSNCPTRRLMFFKTFFKELKGFKYVKLVSFQNIQLKWVAYVIKYESRIVYGQIL